MSDTTNAEKRTKARKKKKIYHNYNLKEYMNLFEQQAREFWNRHIGPDEQETQQMLQTIGVASMDELINKTVPAGIRLEKDLDVAGPISENEYLNELRKTASKNKVFKNYIGQG